MRNPFRGSSDCRREVGDFTAASVTVGIVRKKQAHRKSEAISLGPFPAAPGISCGNGDRQATVVYRPQRE